MTRRYVFNGKFLRAESTGVHRVAAELINAVAGLKAEGHPAAAGSDFLVVHPWDGAGRAAAVDLPRRMLVPLTGIPWEQVTLPLRVGRGTLLNLCNIGPVCRRNAVTMIHDAQVHLSPRSYSRAFRAWYRLVQPMLGRRNRAIVTVSEFSKAQIAAAGICRAERISVVHNGVDHVLRVSGDDAALRNLGLAPQPYVLALSTTQSHKNIALLLRVFADVRLSGVRLVLVGAADAAAFASSGVSIPAGVTFAGRVSDGGLRALMTNALCLAFPSTTEGFGLPPLEAMLLGCPAIVAPCGALPEVCGDAAVYAPPDDAEAWIAAILRLAGSPELRDAQGEIGRKHAQHFTWRRAALTLLAELETLA